MNVTTTNTKRNNGEKKPRIKFTRYTKLYSNFSEAVEDLCDRSEYIYDLISKYSAAESGLPKTLKEMDRTIINIIDDKYPNKLYKKGSDLLWEFTISGNRTTVKTDKYIGFGYSAYVNKIQDNIIENYIFSIDVYGDKQAELIDILEEMGWKKFEPKNKKQSVKKEDNDSNNEEE